MSLIFSGSDFIDVLSGPRKFAGASYGDDDDDEECKTEFIIQKKLKHG